MDVFDMGAQSGDNRALSDAASGQVTNTNDGCRDRYWLYASNPLARDQCVAAGERRQQEAK
jgi:hypothetical protein